MNPGTWNINNNAKHYKQEASVLVSASIVQIILITSEQSPEDFCFEIIGMDLSKWCQLEVSNKANKE